MDMLSLVQPTTPMSDYIPGPDKNYRRTSQNNEKSWEQHPILNIVVDKNSALTNSLRSRKPIQRLEHRGYMFTVGCSSYGPKFQPLSMEPIEPNPKKFPWLPPRTRLWHSDTYISQISHSRQMQNKGARDAAYALAKLHVFSQLLLNTTVHLVITMIISMALLLQAYPGLALALPEHSIDSGGVKYSQLGQHCRPLRTIGSKESCAFESQTQDCWLDVPSSSHQYAIQLEIGWRDDWKV